MEWNSVMEGYPKNQGINKETGYPETKYYVIMTKDYGWIKAMRKDHKWYKNYTSEVVVEVTHWMEIEYPK